MSIPPEPDAAPATRAQLLSIAEALGLTMNGIECVPTGELVEWCEIAAQVRIEARRQNCEAELSTDAGFNRWQARVLGQRAAAARVRVPRSH